MNHIDLPSPVQRYFEASTPPDCSSFSKTVFRQSGKLRTDVENERWLDFSAKESFSIHPLGFSWEATVKLLPLIKISVLDSYRNGIGSGEVKFLSFLTLSKERNTPELNAGALHRYLAESPWFPPSLLPRKELSWTPINDSKAKAALRDEENEVELEFTFNETGDVVEIFTPERWGRFKEGYKKAPWKGVFFDHFTVSGFKIPRRAEVSWQIDGKWEPVWRGEIQEPSFKYKN